MIRIIAFGNASTHLSIRTIEISAEFAMRDSWLTRHFAICAPALAALALASLSQADICKWVDENGVTHYAEQCPEQEDAIQVEIPPPPAVQSVEAESKEEDTLQTQPLSRKDRPSKSANFRSLPIEELGPLPENATSDYLETVGADLTFDMKLAGQFYLSLKAKEELPRGAYVEAHFPNPGNPDRTSVVGKQLRLEGSTLRLLSPKSGEFRCWNYEVEVLIYRDRSRDELLGTHLQTIQSRMDFSLVDDPVELTMTLATRGSNCPSAYRRDMSRMSVEELDALCEREREKHLKPEREAQVRRCIDRDGKDPDWCERYYSDWGDAVRVNPRTVRPALYYDLPECVAAKKAREESGRE